MSDNINHPKYYNQGKYECIDVMESVFGKEALKNFCILNAFKYIYRNEYKNGAEDIKKAVWYLNKYLELDNKTKDKPPPKFDKETMDKAEKLIEDLLGE